MKIFDFSNYKDFVLARVHAMPKRGRGQFLKIAKLLGIHTSMVSHIFKGDSHLSVEQALLLADLLALTELETSYFAFLVQHARAANRQGRAFFEKQLKDLKTRSLNMSERLKGQQTLDERDQAVFYSAWYYSGIRMLFAIDPDASLESVAERARLPLKTVVSAVEFLLAKGLLKAQGKGYVPGETQTYVNREARAVGQHHLNWRMKAVEQLNDVKDEELAFTSVIAVSRADFLRMREEIASMIVNIKKIGDPSPSEELCFLTVDWRKLKLGSA